MNFEPTESQQKLVAMVRDFCVREVKPHAQEWDRDERFPREVVAAVRDAVGQRIAVTVKLNMRDGVPGGFEVDESLRVARWLEADGALDAIELTGGSSLENAMYFFRGDVPLAEMLATTAKKGPKPIYVDPLEPLTRETRALARAEGQAEGQARALLTLLAARFGDVPEETKQRVLRATEPAIERWLPRVLTAPTLEAVLHTPPRKTARKVAKKPARRAASGRKARSAG